MDDPTQMAVAKMATGRRPKQTMMGTQMKLLKPRQRMATPVNCTTSARLRFHSWMYAPNMGARARGPRLRLKDSAVAQKMAVFFQKGDQLSGSCRSSEGWGTSTFSLPWPDLTKW